MNSATQELTPVQAYAQHQVNYANRAGKNFTFEQVFTYTDENKQPIYWKVRAKDYATGDKLIRVFSSDGKGGFINKEPDYTTAYPQGEGKKPLYALPRIMQATEQSIYIVEGEQKADYLNNLGLFATTGGACNTANSVHLEPLSGCTIIVWADNDEAGKKFANGISESLLAIGCAVQHVVIDKLDLPEKGDVMDWAQAREEKGLNTTPHDIQALETVTYSLPLDPDFVNAKDTIEKAIALASDELNPDVGAVYTPDVLQALRYLQQHDMPEYARLRDGIKKCKGVSITTLESTVRQDNGADQDDDVFALIKLASEKCTFVHDADNEAYAIINDGDVRKCWNLQSKSFNEWLAYEFYKSTQQSTSEYSLKAAIVTLTGNAKFEGEEKSIYLRIAQHDGAYWIDLCNEAWQAVRITAQGWQVMNEPSVLFTRSTSMRPLPTPTDGKGDLSYLWKIANIPEQDRLFIITWLLECFRPETPFVVLELSGEQGSAKSSTQSALRDLTDPNKSNLRAAPKNKDDIFVGAKNSHLVSYENLSHLSADYQDALCSLATGAGYAGRTLYSNTDETVIELKKPIVLNGIPSVVTAQDLLDRTLHIDCPPIENTMLEAELEKYWQEHYAAAFTGLLDMFVSALKHLPQVNLDGEKLPRMADFTYLGEAVYMAHGQPAKTFINEYRERRKDGVNRTLESSPVALAMITYLEENPSGFYGTVKELNEKLAEHHTTGEAWIKSPKGLGDALKRLKPAFRQIGILVHKDEKRTMHGYMCSLKYAGNVFFDTKSPNPSALSSSSTCKDDKQQYEHDVLHVPDVRVSTPKKNILVSGEV